MQSKRGSDRSADARVSVFGHSPWSYGGAGGDFVEHVVELGRELIGCLPRVAEVVEGPLLLQMCGKTSGGECAHGI